MGKPIQIHSALRVNGTLTLGDNLTKLPDNPGKGDVVLVNNGLYGYINVGGILTWYPLVKSPDSFQYVQAVAAQEWLVPHDLNTDTVWYQVQDDNGQVMFAADVIEVDYNTLKLVFSEPVTGKALIMSIGGQRGVAGERGRDGVDGTNGVDGASAYQLAVNGGYVGTQAQWLTSLIGPQGPKGADGGQGPQGPKGDTGPQGIPGGDAVYKDNGTFAQAGGTLTLDYTQAKHQRFQVGAAMTLALANWPTVQSGLAGEMLLEIQNGAAFTMTWPTIKWLKSDGTYVTSFASSDTALQANGIDFVLLWTRDGGATVYGKVMR